MEWWGIVKAISGLVGLLTVIGSYCWVYRKGKEKGFLKGVKASEDKWQAEKLKIYAEIQKKAETIKTSKKGAKIVE